MAEPGPTPAPSSPRSPPRRIVLDTNVLVSGMLSPFRAPGRVLDLVLAGDLVPLADDRVLAEYREVVVRAKFGFAAEDADRLLTTLDALAEHVVARPLTLRLPDPDDLPFLEVAVAAAADALVTGNKRHYRPLEGKHAVPVLTPRELMERLAAG